MTVKKSNELKEIWNANAAFWDNRMGEGNTYHLVLIEPNQLEMLDIKKGDKILEIACGNGQFARKMASLGAKVTATDFSDEFIKTARTKPMADKIEYQVIDVTNTADLNKLKGNVFDAVVCTMAFHDIENLEPLIKFLPKILKNGGKFIFSTLHPCFNGGDNTFVHELNEIGETVTNNYYVKISNYLKSQSSKGIGMPGQPVVQYYFHRPLSETLKVCFKNNFYMYDLREPSFKDTEPKNMKYHVFKDIPPVIICSFRLMK